jgi:hypothetical protein
MEKMLPPEAPKKKRGGIPYAASVAGGAVLTAIGALWLNQDANIDNQVAKQTVTSPVEQNNTTESANNTGSSSATASTDKISNEVNANLAADETTVNVMESSTPANAAIPVSITSNSNSSQFTSNISTNGVEATSTETRNQEVEPLNFFQNAFTKIAGISELSESLLALNEEDGIIVPNVADNKRPKAQRNEFGFIGGANLNGDIAGGGSMKPSEFAGLTYTRFINGGLSLKANLLYSHNNNCNTSKIQSVKDYGFGSNIETTTLHTKSLFYVDMPIMLSYGIGNGNLMVGGQASYLVNGYHTLHTTNESITGEFSESETQKFGYMEGFNRFDFALVFGYEHAIATRWNVGARFNYGLTDITKNAYFNNNSFDRNKQLRLYVTYSPFRF